MQNTIYFYILHVLFQFILKILKKKKVKDILKNL